MRRPRTTVASLAVALLAVVPAGGSAADTAPLIPGAPACRVFPEGNVWSRPVAALPVHPRSATLIAAIGVGASLHPDFSRAGGYGIPYQVVGRTLKTYGMILADNGSAWYITGAPHPGWDDDDLHDLHRITGRDFEVVDTRALRNHPR